MGNWIYNNNIIKSISDFPEGCVGFIYKITDLNNGKLYIGRKILKNTNKLKISKKELKSISSVGRKPTKKTVVKESNWLDYFGSCKPLLEEIKKNGEGSYKREILQLCYSKKQMSYFEIKYQMIYEVIEKPELSYNQNILGKFFPKDL